MGKIAAVASLTFLESVRKRVFLVLVSFAVVVLASGLALPSVDDLSRFKVIQSWCLRSISFFGVLIAIFLSATAIPDDIEEKKIFTLLTKPLSRLQYLLGKFVGYSLILAVFLLGTGLLSWGYIRWSERELFPGRDMLRAGEVMPAGMFALSHPLESAGSVDLNLLPSAPAVYWMRCSRENHAAWTFYNVTRETFGNSDDDDPQAEVELDLTLAVEGPWGMSSNDVSILVSSPNHPRTIVMEPVRLRYNQTVRVAFERDKMLPPHALTTLTVAVRQFTPMGGLGVAADSLVLRLKPTAGGFEINLACALLLAFAQFYVVLGLTLLASARLSGPVSMFLGFFLLLAGSMVSFLGDTMGVLDATIASQGGVDDGAHVHHDPDDISPAVLELSRVVVKGVLYLIPDLGRFDVSDILLKGGRVPFTRVFHDLGYALLYCMISLLLGWLLLNDRELK
ncbi:MAG: ABC transporter permease subunit [Planctomycetes bacterium]|nr:ABC transporter permease subunit [Planctomycetota bacterium]